MITLAERLGYDRQARLLIINSDDLGMCQAANEAVFTGLTHGLMTSATVMIPCPWAYDAIAHWRCVPQTAVGVHLTLTSEWETYRWRPLAPASDVRGLIDPDGFMWRKTEEVYQHATPREVYFECKAQIEQAIRWGLDVTHIDSHMGTLQIYPGLIDVYLRLAKEYHMPLRMASQSSYAQLEMFAGVRAQAGREGLVFTDYLLLPERKHPSETTKECFLRILRGLPIGVSETFVHASVLTPELEAIFKDGRTRDEEFRLFTNDADVRQTIEHEGIVLLNYRALRALMRS